MSTGPAPPNGGLRLTLCRVGDRTGRHAAGNDADILAVHGDPLADVAALRSVAAVFRAGVRVPLDPDAQPRTNKQNG